MANQGTVQQISLQNNAVQIDGIWYTLGPKVQIRWIKKGLCEYNIEQTQPGQNDILTFCKSLTQSTQDTQTQDTQTQIKTQTQNKKGYIAMFISYAKDLCTAGKIEANQIRHWVQEFLNIQEEL